MVEPNFEMMKLLLLKIIDIDGKMENMLMYGRMHGFIRTFDLHLSRATLMLNTDLNDWSEIEEGVLFIYLLFIFIYCPDLEPCWLMLVSNLQSTREETIG